MVQKILNSIFKVLAVFQVFYVQYHLENWSIFYAKYFNYTGVKTNQIWSLYSLIGIIKFFMPYMLNELSVWILVAAFYKKSRLTKFYGFISLFFLSGTLLLLIIGFGLQLEIFKKIATYFFHFGAGPSWPAIVLAAFYFFEKTYFSKNEESEN